LHSQWLTTLELRVGIGGCRHEFNIEAENSHATERTVHRASLCIALTTRNFLTPRIRRHDAFDRIDLAILAELQADAGIQNQVLADRVNLSPQPVSSAFGA
jgi:hypothetical protein